MKERDHRENARQSDRHLNGLDKKPFESVDGLDAELRVDLSELDVPAGIVLPHLFMPPRGRMAAKRAQRHR